MNIWLSLNKAITLFSHREALVDGNKRFTYKDFGQRVANLTASLAHLGIKQGGVVAISAPNGHEFVEVYYACAISGIVLSPLNFRLSTQELTAILQDSEASVLICHTAFANEVQNIVSVCPKLKHLVWIGEGVIPNIGISSHHFEHLTAQGTGKMPALPNLQADDLAHLYYTSGTTGRPKGVMLTQGNVTFNALGAIAELGLNDSDVWLHVAPLFHLADAWATFAMTWVGGKHVFLPQFKPSPTLATMEKEKVTITVLVPTMLNALLNDPLVADFDYVQLRTLITGGSPIAPETVRRIHNTFGCEYIQLYGMTETSPWLTISRPTIAHQHLSQDQQLEVRSRTGRPYIGAEVKVVRPDGTEVLKNNREVGEIIAKGPTITPGYWKQPEATKETIKNGWIYTGDLAVIDEDGYINIVDRKKDMIITGGENVYSTEVEYVLYEHPAVHECAVMGVPDEFWGEAVKAIVVLRPGHSLTEQELIEFAKERLAHYKVPRSIDFLPELPKTGSGKIYKKGLREKFWLHKEQKIN